MAKDWDRETSLLAKVPPNLGLNISGAIPSNREMWMWAALGTVLQLASLVVSGTVTYRWNLAQVEVPTTTYGYPCYLLGTLLLTLGVLLCGHIVETVSKERTFRCKAKMRKRVRIFRIQLAATVNDQHFDSYLIFNSPENPDVYASFYQGMKKNTRYVHYPPARIPLFSNINICEILCNCRISAVIHGLCRTIYWIEGIALVSCRYPACRHARHDSFQGLRSTRPCQGPPCCPGKYRSGPCAHPGGESC